MTPNDIELFWLTLVCLLQNENCVLQPCLSPGGQEIPEKLCPGIHNGKNEKKKVGARDEVLGDFFMFRDHDVRSRCIYHGEVM